MDGKAIRRKLMDQMNAQDLAEARKDPTGVAILRELSADLESWFPDLSIKSTDAMISVTYRKGCAQIKIRDGQIHYYHFDKGVTRFELADPGCFAALQRLMELHEN